MSSSQRRALIRSMLLDVITAVDEIIGDVVVVGSDRSAALVASRTGVRAVVQPRTAPGLNGGLEWARGEFGRDRRTLIIMADLARLHRDDVVRVLRAPGPIVVAPSRGGGTGGLRIDDGLSFPPAFGPRSAERHRRQALVRGLHVSTVSTEGFWNDIDTPEDLDRFRRLHLPNATGRTVEPWNQPGIAAVVGRAEPARW